MICSKCNNECDHTNLCGCQDAPLTTPNYTLPTCASDEPCYEILDAKCIVYTGDPIMCGESVIVNTNDSVSEAFQSITDLACSSGGTTFTYEIGQYVASEGGVIAHRWLSTTAFGLPTAGATQNYLVVDTNDLSGAAQWASVNADITNCESTWDGTTNTASMITAGAGSGIIAGTAAVLCNNSTNNSKTDWYLPAIDELIKIWENRWAISQGITNASGTQVEFTDYWSSTEGNVVSAWAFNFYLGHTSNSFTKSSSYNVRAFRRFSI